MIYQVLSKCNGRALTDAEILAEVNRDRSDDWIDYNQSDLENSASDVLDWIDTEFFEIKTEAV
jgi:hypothetical protein